MRARLFCWKIASMPERRGIREVRNIGPHLPTHGPAAALLVGDSRLHAAVRSADLLVLSRTTPRLTSTAR